jgi:hypothetical protein
MGKRGSWCCHNGMFRARGWPAPAGKAETAEGPHLSSSASLQIGPDKPATTLSCDTAHGTLSSVPCRRGAFGRPNLTPRPKMPASLPSDHLIAEPTEGNIGESRQIRRGPIGNGIIVRFIIERLPWAVREPFPPGGVSQL